MAGEDIMAAVNRKYSNIERQTAIDAAYKNTMADVAKANAETDRMKAAAGAKDVDTRAATGQAQIGLMGAQGDAARMQTSLAPAMGQAEMAQRYSAAAQPYLQHNLGMIGADLNRAQFNQNSALQNFVPDPVGGWSDGTSMVSHAAAAASEGPKPSDTVPAMLTPGEAVLTPQAAEILGRPVIELLNALGSAKTHLGAGGMVDQNEGPPEPKAASKEPAKPAQKAPVRKAS